MKTDLEKSHSKWSNFKLTLKSILLVIFFNTLWVILYFIPEVDNKNILYISLSVNILILLLIIISFKNFKR